MLYRTLTTTLAASCLASGYLASGAGAQQPVAPPGAPGPVSAGPGARVELPIRAVRLSDGASRYALSITVNGRRIDAGLDTGSTGLRIMARGLPGVATGQRPVNYGYGSGTELVGSEVRVPVDLGGVSATMPVQKVDRVQCLASSPTCPASRNSDPDSFGIMGDGIPNQGFVAIFGSNINAQPLPNPLQALGVHRWIVELPRLDGTPGRLILNPTPAETAGYAMMPMAAKGDTFPACVAGPGAGGRFCGPSTADSGAPGVNIMTGQQHGRPQRGAPVQVTIGEEGRGASFRLVADSREAGSRLSFGRRPDTDETRIHLGTAPYFQLSVLYDADTHSIGFKPR